MTDQTTDLALISPDELTLADSNSLNAYQLEILLRKTPKQYVHTRPAKGGGTWDYVTGGYMKKLLNLSFGWDWSFEIIEDKIIAGEAIVKGKLSCRSNGREIVKMQYGNKDIIYKRQTDEEKQSGAERIPLSIGNDLKAAATDCLKKCAAEIGFAADIYNKMDFKEVAVDTNEIEFSDLDELYHLKKETLSESEIKNAERILSEQEEKSYRKLHKILMGK